MSGLLKLKAEGGGSVTLAANSALASDITVTAPTTAGPLSVDGPVFSAYQSATQTIPNNAWTKIQLQSIYFDTTQKFDNITNYRFTPNVPGYYQFNATVQAQFFVALAVSIYKNNTGSDYAVSVGQSGVLYSTTAQSKLLYMNGTTDYVELFAYQSSGAGVTTVAVDCAFSGVFVRGV
jgi:hypothetical protein